MNDLKGLHLGNAPKGCRREIQCRVLTAPAARR
jgi:hypothetical protein